MNALDRDHELHTLTGAYAAGALDDVERAAFEAHLPRCASCAREAAELRATAARLGAAESVEPRPELKSAVLARIDTVRQVAPAVPSVDRRPGPRRWAVSLVAAAAVLAAGVAVPTAVHYRNEAQQSTALTTAVTRVMAAPDAVTVTASDAPWTSARVVASRARGEAVLVADGVPAAGAGRTYELWVIGRGGAPRPAGTFDPSGGAGVTRPLDAPLGDAVVVAVTIEREGGVDKPTTEPIATFSLPAV